MYKRRKTTGKTTGRRRRPTRQVRKKGSISSSYRNSTMTLTTARQSPFGRVLKMKMPYYEQQIDLNPGLGGVAWYHFSANGLYDPNVTGTGHQPLGFDQVMPMYDHYTVIGAKITVTAYNSDSVYPQVIGIKMADDILSTNNLGQVIENGDVVYTTVMPYRTDQGQTTLTRKVGIKKFFKKNISSSEFSGTVSSNPTEQVYFAIFVANMNPSFDSGSVNLSVRIDYIALFREPKLLGQS